MGARRNLVVRPLVSIVESKLDRDASRLKYSEYDRLLMMNTRLKGQVGALSDDLAALRATSSRLNVTNKKLQVSIDRLKKYDTSSSSSNMDRVQDLQAASSTTTKTTAGGRPLSKVSVLKQSLNSDYINLSEIPTTDEQV